MDLAETLLQHGAVTLGCNLLVTVLSLEWNQLQRNVALGRQMLCLIDSAEVALRDHVVDRVVLKRPVETVDAWAHGTVRLGAVRSGAGTM